MSAIDVTSWAADIAGAGDLTTDVRRIETLLDQVDGIATLIALHAELLAVTGDRAYSALSFAARIETLFAERPSAAHADALVVVLARAPSSLRRSLLLEAAAEHYGWELLRDRLVRMGGSSSRVIAEWTACLARKGHDLIGDPVVRQAWSTLETGSEADVGWMERRLLGWLVTRAPRHEQSAVAYQAPTPPGDDPHAPRADGRWQPVGEPWDDLRLAASMVGHSNGRALAMRCRRTPEVGGWPAGCDGFTPLDGAPDAFRLAAITPRHAFELLSDPAIAGGAYDRGQGALDGTHAVWRDLRRLLGLPPGTSSSEVAAVFERSACVAYPTGLPWFLQVAWDGCVGIAPAGTDTIALVAWTDED